MDLAPVTIFSFCVHKFLCLNYGPGISVRNSQKLQMRYAQMQGLDWDDLRSVLAVSERGSISGAAKFLNVNHSIVLRRLAS